MTTGVFIRVLIRMRERFSVRARARDVSAI